MPDERKVASARPEAAQPQTVQSEAMAPEAMAPEAMAPEVMAPKAASPDVPEQGPETVEVSIVPPSESEIDEGDAADTVRAPAVALPETTVSIQPVEELGETVEPLDETTEPDEPVLVTRWPPPETQRDEASAEPSMVVTSVRTQPSERVRDVTDRPATGDELDLVAVPPPPMPRPVDSGRGADRDAEGAQDFSLAIAD